MPVLLTLSYLHAMVTTTRADIRRRVTNDVGATTLELVIIVLGLILVAGLLVAAITAAVQRRVNQIN
ncbi:MAG: hypothetical protein J0I40_08520 [Cellulomonas sp.]|uniref:hypothetical protein n=1 Tax=Cellulomonas sp. 73-92 TaxID=1895740 RepID=UPI000928AA4B|nr:hypothetical protein [Cellulomonas sp. 73-92]MBN9375415.1 hypothetical protein [Cellulomonas sp.]OJV78676.1 MAG: hypothetical protein BGO37_12590 [Cellulomonas sp. 73-92]